MYFSSFPPNGHDSHVLLVSFYRKRYTGEKPDNHQWNWFLDEKRFKQVCKGFAFHVNKLIHEEDAINRHEADWLLQYTYNGNISH